MAQYAFSYDLSFLKDVLTIPSSYFQTRIDPAVVNPSSNTPPIDPPPLLPTKEEPSAPPPPNIAPAQENEMPALEKPLPLSQEAAVPLHWPYTGVSSSNWKPEWGPPPLYTNLGSMAVLPPQNSSQASPWTTNWQFRS